jgi:hypothetical protein
MSKEFKRYKEISKTNWGRYFEEGEKPSNEDIQLGVMLRIADATEAMAANHIALMNDRDMYKKWWQEAENKVESLKNSNRTLKGVISKGKKAIAKLKGK